MRGINHHEDFGWSNAPRGGGKGGKGGDSQAQYLWGQQTAVDPATGRTFSASPGEVQYGAKKSAADQLAEFQGQQRTEQQAKSDADKAAADQQSATDESTFQGRAGDAYNRSMQDAIKAFTNAGVNPNDYMSSYITPALDRIKSGLQDKDPNPGASFGPDVATSILNSAISDRRNQSTSALNSVFTPNYANTALPDTISSPYETQILDEQFNPLITSLGNAQKRGQLNDVGYQGAMDLLNQKRSAGQSQIHSLGQNILAQDRSGLGDVVSGARSDISNEGLSGGPDPTSYWNQAASKAADYTSGFGGALRNAVGGTQFADLTDLLNAGGMRQGAINSPAAASTVGAVSGVAPTETDPNLKRGLGNTGAF